MVNERQKGCGQPFNFSLCFPSNRGFNLSATGCGDDDDEIVMLISLKQRCVCGKCCSNDMMMVERCSNKVCVD